MTTSEHAALIAGCSHDWGRTLDGNCPNCTAALASTPSPAQPTEALDGSRLGALVIEELEAPDESGKRGLISPTSIMAVLNACQRAVARFAPSPVQGADDRLAQAEAAIEQAAFALSMGNVSRGRRLLATYQQSPQAALNEVLEVGDVLDASVRYAKTWRAEGGEVFGPRLMLDLVAMTREAQDALNERPASALEEAADEWSKSEVVSHWDGYAENFLRARAAELRAGSQRGDNA